MDVIRFGLGIRALRMRRHLTQEQLASAARVSSSAISRIERGQSDAVTVRTLERVAAVLGARIETRLLWQGEGLDRLLDARHATLVDYVLGLLRAAGWDVASEVSFSIYGERGSIDIFAFHRATGSLLVVEVKSVVPDLQALLAGLDRKGRLARQIAQERGWIGVTSVTRLLILPNDRTARQRVHQHAATFQSALPAGNTEVRRWIRHPAGVMNGILFVTDAHHAGTRHRVAPVRGANGHAARSTEQ